MFNWKVRNVKNSIIMLFVVIFLLVASHFALTAGVSMVDQNGCLRPHYSCKQENYLYSKYSQIISERLTTNQQCVFKTTNYLPSKLAESNC